MNTELPDAAFFDQPVRVFPLGYTVGQQGGRSVIVSDCPGGTPKAIFIPEVVDDCLATVDPSREYSCTMAQAGIFATLAKANILALEPAQALTGIDVIAVARKETTLEVGPHDDYAVQFADGTRMPLSPIGLLWLHTLNRNPGVTVGTVSGAARGVLWGNEEDLQLIERMAATADMTTEDYFEAEVFDFLGAFWRTGLGTFEKPDKQ